MAKRNVYGEKPKPFLTFIYIVVVLALIAALAMMYMKDRDRRRQFKDMVREAASGEMSLDIASLKEWQAMDSDEAEDLPEAPDLTPTPAPTMDADAEADRAESLPEVYLPEPEQVEEAISEK